jgi:hypothetical protein
MGFFSDHMVANDKRNIYILVSRVVRSVSPEVIPYETIFLFLRENKTIEKPSGAWRTGSLHATGNSASSIRL